MSTRTPLSIAQALGSARHGGDHWWVQRLTAVALVPLTFWLAAATVSLVDADH
ncbi:MAG: succinate dehydrogenase, hydrophobic membrane anchor protein, partial [Alphaproteobacteria bacterium]|nr:succinate dehydrogenase, hydrophobic membrane anchor protein [Alphaproteobacteria bacterium]